MEIPPELIPPEHRADRIAELERRIARTWLRHTVREAGVVLAPFGAFLLLWVLDRVPDGALYPAVGVAVAAIAVLTLDTVVRRILPLQRELSTLRRLAGPPDARP